MYDLKVCLGGRIFLFVVYDTEAKEILFSVYLNSIEIIYFETPKGQWFTSENDLKEKLGSFISDVNFWLATIDKNPDFNRSVVWERN